MKKGFTLNTFLSEQDGKAIIQDLFEPGYYNALEIRYPWGIDKVNPRLHQKIMHEIIYNVKPEVSCHLAYDLPFDSTNSNMRRSALDELLKAIEFGQTYGAKMFPFHPSELTEMASLPYARHAIDANSKERRINVMERLREHTLNALRVMDRALNDGEFIVLENTFIEGTLGATVIQLMDLKRDSECKHVGIMFDVAHAVCAGTRIVDEIRLLGGSLKHVHLSDNIGRYDNHLHLGDGQINYQAVGEVLRKVKYDGSLIIESNWNGTASLIKDSQFMDEKIIAQTQSQNS